MKTTQKMLFSFFCLFVVLVVTLVSCNSARVIPPTETKEVISTQTKEIIHDTLIQTQVDSSYYKAWLECKDGKVVLSDNSKLKAETRGGKHLKPPKVVIQDNQLTVNCETEAQKIFLKWKDTYTSFHKDKIITKPYFIDKPLSTFQNIEIWLGRLLLLIISIVGGAFLLRVTKVI